MLEREAAAAGGMEGGGKEGMDLGEDEEGRARKHVFLNDLEAPHAKGDYAALQ